jgi:hypothetical protein
MDTKLMYVSIIGKIAHQLKGSQNCHPVAQIGKTKLT